LLPTPPTHKKTNQEGGLLDEGLHFILKPVPMNELLRSVRMILDA
jgi:hypothetical protein